MVASTAMGLVDPIIQSLQEWTRSKDPNRDPADKDKIILRIKNIFETVYGGIADPLVNDLLKSDKGMQGLLTDAIADAGIGVDINLEYKWAKDDDVPTERKVEVDLRNVQEYKFKPGNIPGAGSVIGSNTEFKYSKRAGVFGAVVKSKPVKNTKGGGYEFVREDVLNLINETIKGNIKGKTETDSLEDIIFDPNKKDKFDKYVKDADDAMRGKKKGENKVHLPGGFNESTSPLPRLY